MTFGVNLDAIFCCIPHLHCPGQAKCVCTHYLNLTFSVTLRPDESPAGFIFYPICELTAHLHSSTEAFCAPHSGHCILCRGKLGLGWSSRAWSVCLRPNFGDGAKVVCSGIWSPKIQNKIYKTPQTRTVFVIARKSKIEHQVSGQTKIRNSELL